VKRHANRSCQVPIVGSLLVHNDALQSEEFQFQCRCFSSGFTLSELHSVAVVHCSVTGEPLPPRQCGRNFKQLVSWSIEDWVVICPFLPVVSLLDEEERPIDGRRQVFEKDLGFLLV
jgi:hypothetical protein